MSEKPVKSKSKKTKIYTAIAFIVLFVGLMFFLFSGGNISILKEAFTAQDSAEVRASLEKFGWKGYVTLGSLSMLQVVFTFLPAEPVQVISGISFGFWKGSLICFVGVIAGNTIIYILYKIYGQKLTEYFQSNAEFDFDQARRSSKISLIVFILYFLPAIPYGMICLFTASLNFKYPKYIVLTSLGSLPSIFIGVGLGHMAIASSWILSLVVFAVLVALLVILFKNRSKVFKKVNEFMRSREAKSKAPKRGNRLIWHLSSFGSKIVYGGKIKVRLKNNVGRLEHPSIVLCNHGSFIDFVYAGRLLIKERPNFVVARLYFYHKRLGKLLRSLGCIPKSMFTADIENAKQCMRVLSSDGILTMMPEARLSTVGEFEGIQASTYRFIQRSGVTVYTLRLNGDYFANPKWGDGARKGSLVEAELNPLLTAEEVKQISLEDLKARVEAALGYNEFEWLETHPELHYKSKTLAEGLENVLCLCPKCGAWHAFKAEGHTLTCEKCGMQATLDDRYAFVDDAPFENFAKWYAWQCAELKKSIVGNSDYSLESKVELRHSSKDGKNLTRAAGEGVCTLNRTGLKYVGTRDGEQVEKFFPMSQIYRLLFGAGEDFEIYEGKEIWYFRPEDRRSCVIWYIASGILEEACEK
ncbi:MAG: VTT domain-containing protein [Clostridia bacterium]|nr:VTT domain-containing protein [Clostridia bacterium]